MKVLAVLLLCGMAAAGGMGRDQNKMYKAWAGMKAMESCWGEENMKIHTINLKLAVAKCHQEDAPELNLPPFRSPYRFINTLMTSANENEKEQILFVYKMIQDMKNHQSSMSQFHSNNDNGDFNMGPKMNSWTENMFKRIAMKSAMKNMAEKFMSGSNHHSMDDNMFRDVDRDVFGYDNMDNYHTSSNFDAEKMIDILFEDKMKENMMKYKMQQLHGSNTNAFRSYNPFDNKNSYRERMSALLQRHKRQAAPSKKPVGGAAVTLPESLDLGDRLADKLKQEQEKIESRVGNMTCVLREMGVINQQNQLDITTQKKALKKFKFPNKWFQDRTVDDMELCNKMANALPTEAQQEYNYPGLVNLSKVEAFMDCCKYSKLRTCVFHDVKKKLETNFGSLEKILEQTQLTENQLFPLVMNLLHGEEMEYFMY